MTPVEVILAIAGAVAAALAGCGIVVLVIRRLDRRYERDSSRGGRVPTP